MNQTFEKIMFGGSCKQAGTPRLLLKKFLMAKELV